MLVKDLNDFLKKLPDDFEIKIITNKRISDGNLKTMSYPYPIEYDTYEIELGDISWSEKVTSLTINLDKPL
jgi:hypothetical protein